MTTLVIGVELRVLAMVLLLIVSVYTSSVLEKHKTMIFGYLISASVALMFPEKRSWFLDRIVICWLYCCMLKKQPSNLERSFNTLDSFFSENQVGTTAKGFIGHLSVRLPVRKNKGSLKLQRNCMQFEKPRKCQGTATKRCKVLQDKNKIVSLLVEKR